MQIVVLGMHRSGTSAIARLLNLMGAYFGAENTSTSTNDNVWKAQYEENKKGFWERLDVRALNDSILHNAHCDWDRVVDFDAEQLPDDLLETYRQTASRIVLNLDAHRPWFVKEPRLCLVYPVWRSVLEMPFCVHIVRNPLEVAHSLKARNGIPLKAGLALWEVYNKRAVAFTSDLPRVFVSYADLMRTAQPVAERLAGALTSHSGYPFRVPSPLELEAFIDQELYRQRSDGGPFPNTVTKSQTVLYERLLEATRSNRIEVPPIGKACLNTLRRFESSGEHLAERMRRSSDLEQAGLRGEDPRLTLKGMELSRALADVANRRTAMQNQDRTINKLRTELHEHKTQLALRNQRVDQLSSETNRTQKTITEQRRRIESMSKANGALESRLAVSDTRAEQLDTSVEQLKATAQQAKENLAAMNAALKALEATSKAAVRKMTEENVQLARRNRRLATEHARMKRDLDDTTSRQADLRAGIADILASRRWRLGHFLLSLPYRLLLRRVPPMATDTIGAALAEPEQPNASTEDGSSAPLERRPPNSQR